MNEILNFLFGTFKAFFYAGLIAGWIFLIYAIFEEDIDWIKDKFKKK